MTRSRTLLLRRPVVRLQPLDQPHSRARYSKQADGSTFRTMLNASRSRRLRNQMRSHARFPRPAQIARDSAGAGLLSLWGDVAEPIAAAPVRRHGPQACYQRAIDHFVLETRSLRTAVSLHQLVPVGPPDAAGALLVRGTREEFDFAVRDPLLVRFLMLVSATFRTPVTSLRHHAPDAHDATEFAPPLA